VKVENVAIETGFRRTQLENSRMENGFWGKSVRLRGFMFVLKSLSDSRPDRFAGNREVVRIAPIGVKSFQGSERVLLSHLTPMEWVEILRDALDRRKAAAEDDIKGFLITPTVLLGVEVAFRGLASALEYPPEIEHIQKRNREATRKSYPIVIPVGTGSVVV
jgi:hypothetical protein